LENGIGWLSMEYKLTLSVKVMMALAPGRYPVKLGNMTMSSYIDPGMIEFYDAVKLYLAYLTRWQDPDIEPLAPGIKGGTDGSFNLHDVAIGFNE